MIPLNFAPLPSFLGGGDFLRNGTSQVSEWPEQKNDFSKKGTINKIFDDLCVRENIKVDFVPIHIKHLIKLEFK